MRSIRRFAYATLLVLGVFSLQPSLAAAEDGGGHFTLAHETHLQNLVLPAGEYAFSVESVGFSKLLRLRNLSRDPLEAGVLTIVNDVETSKTQGVDRLVLVSRNGESFVSALELPDFGMRLRFNVPTSSGKRDLGAATNTVTSMSAGH
ncbi:MAG TPA: hypothetical protein VL983_06270 [Terriglobales bacterium]|nr:hypothetical protein [Terriglobales bacterium]